MQQNANDFTDIVWVTTGFLGDLILTTAGIELAAKFWPKIGQHVITTPLGALALAQADHIQTIIPFDKRGGSTLQAMGNTVRSLREVCLAPKRPVLLQVHRSVRTSLLTRMSRLPTITYMESALASHATFRVPRIATFHEASRIALLLEPLGMPRDAIVNARPRLKALPLGDASGWQRQIIRWRETGKSMIAIAPGSVWGTKRWTKEGFTQLIRLIAKETEDAVILLGSGAEKEICAAIIQDLGPDGLPSNTDRFLDLSGVTSLEDLCRVFPVLTALVCNDSAPLHYASAFDVPTVALFGATIPEMGFGPLAIRSRTLGVELDCRPCSDHGPQVCPKKHFRCMKDLAPAVVFSVLRSITG